MELNAADVASLLSGIYADRSDLLNAVRPLVTDSMLDEIALADWGHDLHKHLAAVRLIRDTGVVPTPLPWEPGEVCRLMRWSHPQDPKWKPGSTGRRGHIMRAFCCVILLADTEESDNQSVAAALESTLLVPEIPPGAALSTFASLTHQRELHDEESPLFALGTLLAAITAFPGEREPVESLIKLCRRWDYTIRHSSHAMAPKSSDWILGLTCFDQHHDTWCRAAKIVLTDRAEIHHPALRSDLAEIANSIRIWRDRDDPDWTALS